MSDGLPLLRLPVEQGSCDVIIRISKNISNPFQLTPSNLVNNSVLTPVPPERYVRYRVGSENVSNFLLASVDKRLKPIPSLAIV